MTENISTNDEIKRRLVIFLRIPAEVWTDVLKIIPRSILVTSIAPACFRLKEISDKNVKNVHVIEKACQFTDKLKADDPDAQKQLEHLAGHTCPLADQFRLNKMRIDSDKSQAILCYCSDLFNDCKIKLYLEEENQNSSFILECLSQLEKVKQIEINIHQNVDQIADFRHHPTFQNCTRVHLLFWAGLPSVTMMTASVNIFDWLHHQPSGMGCDGVSAAADQQDRCMIVWIMEHCSNHIDWLLNRCSENIQQSQGVIDRRPFLLNFICMDSEWTDFDQFRRIENKSTGEGLMIEVLSGDNGESIYRLRRCLAEEEASGKELYARIFKHVNNGFDKLMIDEEKTPELIING